MKILTILSGGLDSTILLYKLIAKYGEKNVVALSFKFPEYYKWNRNPLDIRFQNNVVEIKKAIATCKKLGVQHKIVKWHMAKDILNEMRNQKEIYNGDIKGSQANTAMPFRNMNIISMALSYAEVYNCKVVALGYQKQDVHGYWDTSEEFLEYMNDVAGLNSKYKIEIIAPFINKSKADELREGITLKVPFEDTWSCYNPIITIRGFAACTQCPACKDRLLNFEKLEMRDPCLYLGDHGPYYFKGHRLQKINNEVELNELGEKGESDGDIQAN